MVNKKEDAVSYTTELKNVHNFTVPPVEEIDPDDVGTLSDPSNPALRDFHAFTFQEIEMLREYAKDLDINRASAAVKLDGKQLARLLRKPAVQQEMLAIQDIWKRNISMTATHASAKFLEILELLQKDYTETREPKLASPMAGMASTYLKATGQMGDKNKTTAPQLVIHIDLGNGANAITSNSKNLKDVTPETPAVTVEQTL